LSTTVWQLYDSKSFPCRHYLVTTRLEHVLTMHLAHSDIPKADGDHERHNRGLPAVGHVVSAVTSEHLPSLEPIPSPSSHASTDSPLVGPILSSPTADIVPHTSSAQSPTHSSLVRPILSSLTAELLTPILHTQASITYGQSACGTHSILANL
jgi:hypothetical protein